LKINITVVGKFEHLENGDEKIDIEIDLLEMNNTDFTFNEIITEEFEKVNGRGCMCSFNESQNHCDCDGYGYEYEYKIININSIV
jgi:hypothetical protein